MVWIGERFKYTPPWKLTRGGCLFGQGFKGTFVGFACDEYHNRTFYFMVPLVGFFAFWYGRHLNWSVIHLNGISNGKTHGFIDVDCDLCAEMLGYFLIDTYAENQ